jgi:phosphoadenosine phosphosulfate reductase
MSSILFDNVKTASRITDSVIVLFSGGKDSVITLNLCCRYFKRVVPYFMYIVPGLSFHNAMHRWVKTRYGLDVKSVPHFMISEWLRYGTLRHPDLEVPIIKTADLYNYIRHESGVYWIAAGERINDSIVRRAMIKNSGTIDDKRGRFYPVAMWSKKDVVRYIKNKKLKVSPESKSLGHSFRSLMPEEMFLVRKHYPDDYKKIQQWFPYVDASLKQYEYFHGKNQQDKVPVR